MADKFLSSLVGGSGTALGEITRLFPDFPDDYERDGQKFLRSGFAITSGWDTSLDAFLLPAGVWSAVTSGFGSTAIRSVATDEAGVWVAVGDSGTMTRSTNDGASWTAVTSGFGSTAINSIATDNAGVWVAVGDSGVMTRSTNDGASWTAVTSGFGSTLIWSIATDEAGVWVAVGDSGVMTRADGLTFGIDTGNDVDYVRYL